MMLGLGIREGSKEWKYRHHYWSECIKAGKARNVLDYIWKNMKARLGKDAMRENAAGTVPCKKTGAEEPHSDPACGRHGISDTM